MEALGHPQRPRQAQVWRVQQVLVMFIKNWHGTCLYAIFQKQIDSNGPNVIQGDQEALRHPQ